MVDVAVVLMVVLLCVVVDPFASQLGSSRNSFACRLQIDRQSPVARRAKKIVDG